MTDHKVGIITHVQIFGNLYLRNLKRQKIKNSAQFRTTSEFDRKYFCKETTYLTSVRKLIDSESYRILVHERKNM